MTGSWIYAFDGGEWTYYLAGHDESELLQIDEIDVLQWEKLWMRPIRASQADNYGISDDYSHETVLRDRATGRFKARMLFIECRADDRDAQPWMGVKYAPVG